VGLDPECERGFGMADARGANAESPDLLVASILQLADGELRGQIVDVDRKERVVHTETEELPHRSGLLRAADAKGRPWVVRGAEERDALDVIPVKMREQEIHREGPVVAAVHERGAELAKARARIEDEKRSRAVAHLDARGIVAIAHGQRPRCRDGPARAPETDLHELAAWSRSERPVSGDFDMPSSPGFGHVCFIESSVHSRS